MKKLLSLFAGVVLSVTLYAAGTFNSTATHESSFSQKVTSRDVVSDVNAVAHDYALNSSEGWSVIEVPTYDSYGRRMGYSSAEVAMKRTSNGYIYKARLRGYRYDNDEWFPVTRGSWRCGDMICKFRFVQWEVTSYFNL